MHKGSEECFYLLWRGLWFDLCSSWHCAEILLLSNSHWCRFAHEDEDDEDGGAESELDDSDSEVELAAEEEAQEAPKGVEDICAAPYKCVTTPGTAPSGTRGRRKSQDKPSEEVGSLEIHWKIITWKTNKKKKTTV